jgi:hypothetical protein
MTERDRLFLQTLDDLSRRVDAQDPYEILGASALIRKLLLDSEPLIDQVNRQHRLKLRFRVGLPRGLPPGLPEPVVWTKQDGLDPEAGVPGTTVQEMTRDQFLATPVLKVRGRQYTVREVILFEANIMGGVHAGSAKEEQEQVLQQLNEMFTLGGYRASLRQLKAIGKVILYGLQPLYDAVKVD